MKQHVRFAVFAVALSLSAAGSARAQAPDDHKPGGLNKVAHDARKPVKKAGRDTKAEVKRDASKGHHVAQDAGNNTKTVLKKATGIHGSTNENPLGLHKGAPATHKTGKKAARDTRAEKDRVKSNAHGELKETGIAVKDTVLKGKKP